MEVNRGRLREANARRRVDVHDRRPVCRLTKQRVVGNPKWLAPLAVGTAFAGNDPNEKPHFRDLLGVQRHENDIENDIGCHRHEYAVGCIDIE
jgi:hypothetical protein